MFCPRCGQKAAEGVSFCSRCGLPLDAAAALLESGGGAGRPLTPRQRGARKGALLMVGGLIFFLLAALMTAAKQDLFIFLPVAAVVFTFGLMRMLYGLLLEDDRAGRKAEKRAARQAKSAAELPRDKGRAAELPHARSVPADLYARAGADTSDMTAAPPSVAEGTTRLLDD